ncbi:hypothetical protein BaRGS_00030119 [Batillaria attramentaria]|uniref:ANK_REP_REGION domain-containing protein n=1 Tax=Batillaria attramentaria TaxID=370345 RepID=A0ABD0JU74_9CAEN
MLSLSIFGNPGSSSMKAPTDARKEAVTFLGLLRHNEDHLVERTKQLLKKDRRLIQDMFTSLIDEWTPLHACTLRGARKLVKMAMKAGVHPDLEMGLPEGLPGRCTPLHLAAYRGDVSIIQLLVQNNASLNARDSTNRTPLYYAASRNNTFAARKLIKYGAEISDLTHEQRVYYKEDIEREDNSGLYFCIKTARVVTSVGKLRTSLSCLSQNEALLHNDAVVWFGLLMNDFVKLREVCPQRSRNKSFLSILDKMDSYVNNKMPVIFRQRLVSQNGVYVAACLHLAVEIDWQCIDYCLSCHKVIVGEPQCQIILSFSPHTVILVAGQAVHHSKEAELTDNLQFKLDSEAVLFRSVRT